MDKEGWWRTQVETGYWVLDTGTQDVPWHPWVYHGYSSLAFILQEGFLGQVSTSSTGTGPSLVVLGEILGHRRKVQ